MNFQRSELISSRTKIKHLEVKASNDQHLRNCELNKAMKALQVQREKLSKLLEMKMKQEQEVVVPSIQEIDVDADEASVDQHRETLSRLITKLKVSEKS